MENKTQHTPGPWIAHTAHESLRVPDSVNAECGLHVCDVASYGAAPSQRHANAHLIAAAPDLLEALNYIEAVCRAKAGARNGTVDLADLREFASIARAAIAKAEGGAEQ
jgi:hypothetical protein